MAGEGEETRVIRLCAITGSRADYGPMRSLLFALRDAEDFDVRVTAIGPHLTDGSTSEIEADGFEWNRLFVPNQYAAAIVLGDRSEIDIQAAILYRTIPLIHLYGGERTDGSEDDASRHAITKHSHLHFVAAEPYRQRVIQLGEHPERVFTVGALATDFAVKVPRAPEKRILCTWHPCEEDVGELLAALTKFPDHQITFTGPNTDPGGDALAARLKIVCQAQGWRYVHSMGQDEYLAEMARSAVVVGNSSSLLVETPAMGVPSVVIGTRQLGRLFAWSAIGSSCAADAVVSKMQDAMMMTVSPDGYAPYGRGGVAPKIIDILRRIDFKALGIKRFRDR